MAKKTEPEPVVEPPAAGKGRATPSRRAAQQARQRPLVPTDRRAASKASKATMASERERARIGYMQGDERYMPVRDRGPQKRFARDWVDSRWSLGELAIPLVFVLFLGSTLFASSLQYWFFGGMYTFLLLVVLNGLWMARAVRKRLAERFGAGNVERGLNLYVVMRSAQFRRMRGPRPQLRRGETPAIR